MGMTMTQKILAAHAHLPVVKAGDLIEAKLDLVLGNDITAPVAVTVFDKAGFTEVFDKDRIVIVLDHYTPCKDIKSAQLCRQAREFAARFGITHLYDVGQAGIEHALLPEKGLVAPGEPRNPFLLLLTNSTAQRELAFYISKVGRPFFLIWMVVRKSTVTGPVRKT